MGFFSGLTSIFRGAANVVASVGRTVANAVVAGVAAVVEVGSRVVGVVRAGWEGVKSVVKRAVEKVVGPIQRAGKSVSKSELNQEAQKRSVKVETTPTTVSAPTTVTIRVNAPFPAMSPDAFAVPPEAARPVITQSLLGELKALVAELDVALQQLLASKEVQDFSSYARMQVSLRLLTTIWKRVSGEGMTASVTETDRTALRLLQKLSRDGDLHAEEWELLEAVSFELWGQSLLQLGVEGVFLLWTSEYLAKREEWMTLGQQMDVDETRRAILQLRARSGRITPAESESLAAMPATLVMQREARTAAWARLAELKQIVGVSEGMLVCLLGEEEDVDLIRDSEGVGRLLMARQNGGTLNVDETESLDTFAMAYERRATQRLQAALTDVELSA